MRDLVAIAPPQSDLHVPVPTVNYNWTALPLRGHIIKLILSTMFAVNNSTSLVTACMIKAVDVRTR